MEQSFSFGGWVISIILYRRSAHVLIATEEGLYLMRLGQNPKVDRTWRTSSRICSMDWYNLEFTAEGGEERILVSTEMGEFIVLDSTTLEPVAGAWVGDCGADSFQVCGNFLMALLRTHEVAVFDLKGGGCVWRKRVGAYVRLAGDGNRRIGVVGTSEGNLMNLQLDTGELVLSSVLNYRLHMLTLSSDGQLLIVSVYSRFYVFDFPECRLLQSMDLYPFDMFFSGPLILSKRISLFNNFFGFMTSGGCRLFDRSRAEMLNFYLPDSKVSCLELLNGLLVLGDNLGKVKLIKAKCVCPKPFISGRPQPWMRLAKVTPSKIFWAKTSL